MEIIKLSEENFDELILKAKTILKKGGVIIYPTDTLYGLGVLASNEEAVKKVKLIKNRIDESTSKKPISIIVSDKEMLENYVETNDSCNKLISKYLPGKLTLILKSKNKELSKNLNSGDTLGIRIPDNNFVLNLVKELGEPITTTSANLAGQSTKSTVDEILEDLGENIKLIDLAIDQGVLSGKGSTVVDFTNDEIKVLREGEVVMNF